MSLRQKYLKVLAELVPAGAASISLLLGSSALGAANSEPPQKSDSEANIAERLAVIRSAVSEIVASDSAHAPRVQLAKALNSGSSSPPPQSAKPPTTTSPTRRNYGWPPNPWNNWHNWNNWGNWFRNW